MSHKFIIDMNLSPDWIAEFRKHGYEATHWRDVGRINATDESIMEWARAELCVVFTHDLDFGTILALTNAATPSVVLLRGTDVMPVAIASSVFLVINSYKEDLEKGALLTIDARRSRIRLLPLFIS